jgi:DNA-3-methyladenine glycosylase
MIPARLRRCFFARDTRLVARELLGMSLVRLDPIAGRISGIIVEAEAYCPGDAASHAYRGQTTRNAPMFGEAGIAYVYFTYGMHYCFNIVTEAANTPAAVLIRALEPREGVQAMIDNRARMHSPSPALHDLCRGPARLCKSLKIDRTFNGYDLTQPNSELFIEEDTPIPEDSVQITPRVRVRGDEKAIDALWRWSIKDGSFVSK